MDSARRQHRPQTVPRETAYRFGDFEFRPGRQLLRGGALVPLGRIALDLLGALLRARGDLVTKDELFDAAWPGVVVVENALHQHMRALRTALGEHAGLIATVARRGYRFAGQSEEFEPADRSADAFSGPPPLPSPLTPLIGREDELLSIDALLGTHRCLTLLGPGGAGKTRLALEIAWRWVARGGAAVSWVELAGIADADGVAGAIAASCGLVGPLSLPPLARVRNALRTTAALLVLDNCEHLVETCASAAHELLQASPGLRLMATSQRPLCIAGEQRLRVAMLGLPPVGTADTGVIAAAPAVQLLLARVEECNSQWRIEGDALQDAAELCRQLDGNALAIELAATQVAVIGLAATSAALADRFRLLALGPRNALPKHRSLHAMIDWSHALLGAEQAAVFRRLAVFVGGWTIDAAVAIADAATHDRIDTAACLAELVERSMVVCEGSTQRPRFRMLEAQRLFAIDKLRASGEYAICAAAHARYFAVFFEAGQLEWDESADAGWIARHGPERDNLRSAIRFALATSDPTLAARLVASSIWLWRASGAAHELRQLLQQPLLRNSTSLPEEVQASLKLALACSLHWTSSESASVRAAAADAVCAFEGSHDVLGAANSLLCLASAFAQLGDTASHQASLGRVDRLLGQHHHGKTYAWYCGSHAWAAQLAGNLPAALGWVMRSRAAYRGSGAWHGETRAMLHLADLQLAAGNVEQAIAVGQECVARLQGGQHRGDLGRALANLAAAWFANGDFDRARDGWARALEELRGHDFSYWIFDHIALLAITEGRDDAAAQMVGYADAGYARLHKGRRVQNEQRARDRALAHLSARCTADELAALLATGADSREDDMVALVLRPAMVERG